MRTIIGISGGLDSAFLLHQLLTTTDDQVLAVELDTSALQGDDLPIVRGMRIGQAPAPDAIAVLDWLADHGRPFVRMRQQVRPAHLAPDATNNPQTLLVEVALDLINGGFADRIAIATERENDGFANAFATMGAALARDRFVARATRGAIVFPLIAQRYHQGVALRALPPDLLALTRSCDSPAEAACGHCFKCGKRQFFAGAIETKSDEEIAAYIDAKSILPDGRWRTMKDWLGDEGTGYASHFNGETYEMPTWPSDYEVPA